MPEYLTRRVREYVEAAELGKRGSCHLLRHSMATLMLENGADVRFVQEMLGHANVNTTQIYTHVSIRKLQEIHAATHPGAPLKPRASSTTSEATTPASENATGGPCCSASLTKSCMYASPRAAGSDCSTAGDPSTSGRGRNTTVFDRARVTATFNL